MTNLAIEIGKRKAISSSSSNSNSSSNNNSSSSYQDVVNVSTDDEEDINENALTIKEIIFGMALKKVKSIHTSPLSPLNLTTHFFYSFGGLNGLNRKSEPSLNSMKDQLSTFTCCHLLTNEKTTIDWHGYLSVEVSYV